MNQTSYFQEAIDTVENLTYEEKRAELIEEIKQAEKEYKEGKFKKGSVKDLMAELED